MKTIFALAAIVVCFGFAANAKSVVQPDDIQMQNEESKLQQLIRGIMVRQMEERRYLKKHNREYVSVSVVPFSWKDCGPASDVVHTKTLTLEPSPITIPGEETVSFDINVAADIIKPTKLSLTIKKKIFGVFIEVPCVDNIGSCSYGDPCSLLANITCPPVFKEHGISCRCPIKAKEYKLPSSVIQIPKLNIPSSIENGDYEVSAKLLNGGTELACFQVIASLKSA